MTETENLHLPGEIPGEPPGLQGDLGEGSPRPAETAEGPDPGIEGEKTLLEVAESPGNGDPEAFRVRLEIFEGPLELLLHLVREHELDIHDIPIAFITDQYLRYIEMMRHLNIDLASDYLVMASHLVYIKSRTLLPQPEGEEIEETDVEQMRQELQRQIIEYQKFKRLSEAFRRAEKAQGNLFSRGGNGDDSLLEKEEKKEESPRIEVTVFDLISAIGRLIEESGEAASHLVQIDELEVADRLTHILELMEGTGPEGVAFHDMFPPGTRALELVATFLALLELIRQNLVIAYQVASFGEIRIQRAVRDD